MIRIPKDLIDGALYYVTVRGDHSEEIFKDKDDYRMYVQLLSKYKLQYGFKLFSFVLLSNHLHLLFELKDRTSISDIMHDLNTNYTKYFNAKFGRKGHLFQERSRMVLAEKDKYLLPILAYVHLNPYVLGLVSDIDAYPYSSHVLYVSTLSTSPNALGMSFPNVSIGNLSNGSPLEDYGDDKKEDSRLRGNDISPTEEKGEGIDLTEEINEVVKQLASLPVNRLILRQAQDTSSKDTEQSRSAGESANQPTDKPANRPTGQPANRQTGEPADRGFYSNFINSVSKDEMNILGKELAKKIVLGSDDFVKKVEQKMEEKKIKSVDAVLLNEYESKTTKQRKFILAGTVAVVILAAFTVYLFASGLWLKESFNQELIRKDEQINTRLYRERKEIVQDLEEKHQADMVSYNAMARRLEYEKQKALELEAKIR